MQKFEEYEVILCASFWPKKILRNKEWMHLKDYVK